MPDDPRTDDDLVRAINAGPPGAEPAFAALYHRHKAWALRLARRMTPRDADAADIVQDTFITLLRQFPGFTLRGKLTTFLYPVIRNRALALTRTRRHAALDAETPEQAGASLPADLSSLRAAVERLPEPQQEVLLMRLVDNMDVLEVAVALNIPPGTVKSRLHAALTSLRADPQAREWFE